jgi:C1A family cysteine protease
LLECTNSSDCSGGIVEYAFNKVISGAGIPNETLYPYKASSTYSGKPSTTGICSVAANKKNTNTKYTTSKKYYNVTQANLKNLVSSSPLAVLIYANNAFMSYKTGNFSCGTVTKASQINHAVTLIGYDAAGNWLIKNSWGTSWGIKGFGWIQNTYDCGLKLYVYQFAETKVASFGNHLVLCLLVILGLFIAL